MKLVLFLQISCFLVFGGFVGAMHNRIVELEKVKAYGSMMLVMDVEQLTEVRL